MTITAETQHKSPLDLETTSIDYLAQTINKIQQLPKPLVKEVSDFVDFILVRQDHKRWQQWNHFYETLDLSESDFSDYLTNLETYEERLARGEIQW
ncbi:conserved hypothetical protein [Beggiatoa sp. PS]|nr:conserved hypothetical protein [Beggiatoa sp. PS]